MEWHSLQGHSCSGGLRYAQAWGRAWWGRHGMFITFLGCRWREPSALHGECLSSTSRERRLNTALTEGRLAPPAPAGRSKRKTVMVGIGPAAVERISAPRSMPSSFGPGRTTRVGKEGCRWQGTSTLRAPPDPKSSLSHREATRPHREPMLPTLHFPGDDASGPEGEVPLLPLRTEVMCASFRAKIIVICLLW